MTSLAAVLAAAGVVVTTAVLVWPEQTISVYGDVKTAIDATVQEVAETIAEQYPTVRLSGPAQPADLDRCDGTFMEMETYRGADDVPPVYAAHNNCSGDILLPWELGQHVRVDGSDQLYEVVDVRETAKRWETTDALAGLDGEFALQTCYYGVSRMKFVGLAPVPTDAAS